jgi:hypothetical protein
MRAHAATRVLAIGVLWLGSGFALSLITRRIADWFVMTDELLYERLALSIVRTHSVVPHVHTEVVANINQLYPLVLASVFRHGEVLHGFHEAHVLNAFVMTSAAIPAYLLARRVTANWWLPYVVAITSVAVPWLALSSFLLSEVVAYPAFVLALLALQASIARPSVRNDVLAVAAIALAVLARTQFYALAIVLAAAILLRGAVERRFRETLREHVALVALYVVGGLTALVLLATGHHVLGTYAQTAKGNPFPWHMIDSSPAHLATVALAGGLVPFIVGGAWIAANLGSSETRERGAFAWLAVSTIVTLTIEVTSFDLRFGGGIVRDRYLFYLTPVLLIACAAGLTASRLPRWSLAAPLIVLAIGFAVDPLPTFQKFNADTPASVLDDWLLRELHGVNGARIFLVLAAVVLGVAFLEASMLAPRVVVAAVLSGAVLLAVTAETGYAFKRLFAINGTSGLPLTLDQSPVFEWVDREINTESKAVLVPYPVIPQDYWANVGYWWDLEFWNKTVEYEAGIPNEFSGTPPGSFPKLAIRFDNHTGRANVDPDAFVLQAVSESRFHIAGTLRQTERNYNVVAPQRPWRADWISYGLYDDGWSRPNRAARIRVFAQPGQTGSLQRTVTLVLVAPQSVDTRPARISTNTGKWPLTVNQQSVSQAVNVCVPAHGYADITVRIDGSSAVPADLKSADTYLAARDGGVLFQQIALADETSPC